MRLKRFYYSYTTAGRWATADRHWKFISDSQGWRVLSHFAEGTDGQSFVVRAETLALTGLDEAYFKTRREAIAALQLFLASSPLGADV